MRPVIGIICEYNPFHLGHAHQYDLIRHLYPDALIICVMSGCFTQRGAPTLHLPRTRAEAALHAGADMVFELPCAFSVRDAEHFALGGVSALNSLGFVTHLSFGAEDDDLALLKAAADLLLCPTPAFTSALKKALETGTSFAAAQGSALEAVLGHGDMWARPNNILAMCYLRALRQLGSCIEPLPVRRDGDYHASGLTDGHWPSASAARKAFLQKDFSAAYTACGYELPRQPVHMPDALDLILLHKLRSSSAEALARLPDCTEGLENRLKSCADQAATHAELLDLLKTKRYAYARLNRLCTHALLDITDDLLQTHPLPKYLRLLGLRKGSPLTSLLTRSGIPIVAKAADGDRDHPLYRLDMRAYELWALGAGLPAGLMLRQGMAVV